MKKIVEFLKNNVSEGEALKLLSSYSKDYPTKSGYKLECWISENFIRITIYK